MPKLTGTARRSTRNTSTPGATRTFAFKNPYDPSSVDTTAGFRYGFSLTQAGLAADYANALTASTKVYTFPTAGTYTVYSRIFDKDGGYSEYVSQVSVSALNAALALLGSANLPSSPEDITNSAGELVSTLIADRITDAAGGTAGIAVTGLSTTANGTWQYSTNDGGTWTSFGAVTNTSASVLGASADDRVRFVPAANYNGSANITFRAWDRTDDHPTGTTGVNVSSNGGGTAYSLVTATASITVTEVNDAPIAVGDSLGGIPQGTSFTIPLANLYANDSKGAANESGQALSLVSITQEVNCTLQIVSTNLVITPINPGSASFRYTLTDNGTTNGVPDPKTSFAFVTMNVTPAFTFQTDFIGSPPLTVSAAVWADVDNDGDLDAIATVGKPSYVVANGIYLNRNNGGTFTLENTGIPAFSAVSALSFGDYDGDDDLDLAVAGYTGGA